MAKKSGGGRSSALQQPVQPDDKLAAVVGSNPLPRTEITKKIWDYIKSNDLQDPSNKRVIRADAKLRPIFDGKDSVDMFEMTRLVNQHVKKG
jgi:upstream activation factor subunit UAF30